MKKAFDQNVSRAKPRVRLGAFAAEVARLRTEPPSRKSEDEEVEEQVEAFTEQVSPAPVETKPRSGPRKVEARKTEATPPPPTDLAGERRARAERNGTRRLAAEAVEMARTAPAVLRDRLKMSPELEGVSEDEPASQEPEAREEEILNASSAVEPAPVAQETSAASIDGVEVEARRSRLKERLKAVRENPRPEPLPPTSAQAGHLAVERIAFLQTEVNKLKATNLRLTQELETARRHVEKATEEAKTRIEEASRLASEMETRAALLAELEKELSSLEGERDEALLALQDARRSLEAGEKEREGLREEILQRQKSLDETLSEEERIAGELEVAQIETATLRRSVEALQTEREMLAKQVADLTAERADLLESRKALQSIHRALSQAALR